MNLKIKRLCASFIDFLVIFGLIFIATNMINVTFNNNYTIVSYINNIIITIFFILLVYKDLMFKNASVGKKIMNIEILYENEIPSKKTIIKRNSISLIFIAFYFFQILINNKSMGDIKYNTEVKSVIK